MDIRSEEAAIILKPRGNKPGEEGQHLEVVEQGDSWSLPTGGSTEHLNEWGQGEVLWSFKFIQCERRAYIRKIAKL